MPDRLVYLVISNEIVPAVNQVELQLFPSRRNYSVSWISTITAPWLGLFAEGHTGFFQPPVLAGIGTKYGKTPAQVILRWLFQSRIVDIPRLVHAERIYQIFVRTISCFLIKIWQKLQKLLEVPF